ncbi:MAG: hypothetical protein CVT94_06930 [Bacteroidetes bacterium HGW-Bacteroidetes-11]|nr:MAG: hypothetical protein CVT94_06930 [Bacteroidetes bacterium HGW-Bacteroidetes-11]
MGVQGWCSWNNFYATYGDSQVISHLRLTDKRLGYLINFNVPLIKDGIRRFIR